MMLTDRELADFLELTDPAELQALYRKAYEVKLRHIGRKVSLRGLIEISNICRKNCYYCGIRSGNTSVRRYRIDAEDIIHSALWALEHHYGSIVLQSGEVVSEEFSSFIENLVREIRTRSDGRLGITLCCGEQTPAVYERWRKAGAHRYLLRIETSDPVFYAKLHPADHNFEARKQCLRELRKLDYQVGSGVMSGLPGQTTEQLVHDLRFFQEFDLDMIGMGPYIPHCDTPLGKGIELTPEYRKKQLEIGLKMIACTRLLLADVNIASTTALQALSDTGREQGLLAGANVIMPNVTDTSYRRGYQLYADKPALDENSEQSSSALTSKILSIGEQILWDEYGDSRHYFKRKQE